MKRSETISVQLRPLQQNLQESGVETNKSDTLADLAGRVREKYFIFVRKLIGVPVFFGARS